MERIARRYILSSADHKYTFVDKGVAEARVVDGRSDTFAPLADPGLVIVGVLGNGNVDEGNVHVLVAVLGVRLDETIGRPVEPLNLAGFDPVIAGVLFFVGRVRVRVEEINGNGRVVGAAAAEHLYVVVADAVNVGRTGLSERVGQGFHNGHLRLAAHGLRVVVVSKDGSVGKLALLELESDLEDGLASRLLVP